MTNLYYITIMAFLTLANVLIALLTAVIGFQVF